jgi:hypothetical protein
MTGMQKIWDLFRLQVLSKITEISISNDDLVPPMFYLLSSNLNLIFLLKMSNQFVAKEYGTDRFNLISINFVPEILGLIRC